MKILVIGKSGQLSYELSKLVESTNEYVFLGRDALDLANVNGIKPILESVSPDVIINAAAYTAVDKAESEPSLAFNINFLAVQEIAAFCALQNIRLIHVSTDFVYDGQNNTPYKSDDSTNPISVYGESKLKGEQAIKKLLPEQHCIIRTSWVYSTHGGNFVKTMLSLMASKPELGIISDQIGSPTNAKGLAKACLNAALNKVCGTFHYTDLGVASWYDFAVEIQDIALELALLPNAIKIKPISTQEYPTPAKRPHYSVLCKKATMKAFSDVEFLHWRHQLRRMMLEYKENQL
ncbi:NAD(P)-dependent oxidoreductase [Thalassotalea loyana]|uniref:dTDP-4-dehydrorhamnose reductase n=1 Tax=Thalassotalea loyana TaxID=280483 RepID=A0ABQ6HGQ9_9GAMM|nr:dTDP-4-dehydrorhamnose reductase [Thalassotalea loyana]GLX86659.1 NAD(P)-dependent oxidoreductase [Thalassotalea loyana]